MSKIVISCDTTVAMSKEQLDNLNIEVIPLNAIANGVEYHDTVDIDTLKLCDLMRKGASISTSTPSPFEIEEYFDRIFEKTNADYIIHFTISSKLSSMFSLFTQVCKEKYGNKVIVIDSLSVCEYMANQVKYAKELVDANVPLDEILKRIEEIKNTEYCIFIPESLEYLKRGGRVSPAVAAIAGFIGVIPILTFSNGEVGKKGLTRTAKKAYINECNEWKKIPNFEQDYRIVILDADSKLSCDTAKEIIKEIFPNIEIGRYYLSLNVAAHAGPGTIGVGYVKKYKI